MFHWRQEGRVGVNQANRRASQAEATASAKWPKGGRKWSKDGMLGSSRVTGRAGQATQGLGSHIVDFPRQVPSQGWNGGRDGVSERPGVKSQLPHFLLRDKSINLYEPRFLLCKGEKIIVTYGLGCGEDYGIHSTKHSAWHPALKKHSCGGKRIRWKIKSWRKFERKKKMT